MIRLLLIILNVVFVTISLLLMIQFGPTFWNGVAITAGLFAIMNLLLLREH